MSSQVIIDQLVMDLYADQTVSGSADIDRYLNSVKDVILPMVASRLENQLNGVSDMIIEQLEISVSQSLETNWHESVSAEIANQISIAVERQLSDQQLMEGLLVDREESKELAVLEKYLFFSGGEPLAVNKPESISASIATRAAFGSLKSKHGYLPIGSILKLPIAVFETVIKDFKNFPLNSLLGAIENQSLKRLIIASILMSDVEKKPFNMDIWGDTFIDLLMQDVAMKPVLESEIQKLNREYASELERILHLYNDQINTITDQYKFITQENRVSRKVLQLIEALESSGQLSDYARKWFAQSLEPIAKQDTFTFKEWLLSAFVRRPDSIMMKECSEWRLNDHFSGEVLINIKQLKEVIERASSNRSNKRSSELSEPPTVANGGLVLLHPFLPQLFKSCQLMDDKSKWVDEQAQVEAIYLLHFLANGEISDLSADFTIEKLLTGCDMLTDVTDQPPVDPLFEYAEEPLAEMLIAIQQYWPPMKNNSWTSLRRDFLMREATLEGVSKGNPVIKVQPHTLDVLIPYIKWGLKMVRYSWMQDVLKIVWGKD